MNPETISLISRIIVGCILGEILLMLYVYINKRFWNTLRVEDKFGYKLTMLFLGFASTYTMEVIKSSIELIVLLYKDIGFAITWVINNMDLVFNSIFRGIGTALLAIVVLIVFVWFVALNLRLCDIISGKPKRRRKSRRKRR